MTIILKDEREEKKKKHTGNDLYVLIQVTNK